MLENRPELTGTNREKLLSMVQDTKLAAYINEVYRPGASVGDGGTADKLIMEFYEGSSRHLPKAKERLVGINRIIDSGKLGLNDLDIAEALRDDFLKQMTIYFPTIKKDLDEHIQEFGERLDTIVIEDIIMPEIIELLEKDADTKKLKVIFDYFEDVCINSDDYLNNVFSITALEILGNDKNILEKAKKYMGPITIKLQREADIAIGRQV